MNCKHGANNSMPRAKLNQIAYNRLAAAAIILEVFHENKDKFRKKMQEEFEADPIMYYKLYLEPLQPKKMEMQLDLRAQIASTNIDLTKLKKAELENLKSIITKAEVPKQLQAVAEAEFEDEPY